MDHQTTTGEEADSTAVVGSNNGVRCFGVAFNRWYGKWAAAVAVSGRMKFLGYHATEEAATRKVAEAAAVWTLVLKVRRHD